MFSLKDLIAMATAQGWRIERTQGSHWKFIPPDRSKRIVILAGTPSNSRSIKNSIADLRRSGFAL